MQWAFLALIIFLSAASSASAITREELVCPVRADWRGGSTDCPCERHWRPTNAELWQIIEDHHAWLSAIESVDEGTHVPGRAILCHAQLREADLRGANLQEADLGWANLQEAELIGANLQEAELIGANLQEANLHRANLQEAYLGEAKLQEADLGWANLQEANLIGANLQEADLIGANLNGANLNGANLQEADLSRANLQEADLIGANLQEANLPRAKLQEANLGWANLQEANLGWANLQEARLISINIENASLAHSNLDRSVYAPASRPPDPYVEGLQGLTTVRFPQGSQSGLVQLREHLRSAGLRDLEREATFAIEHNRSRHARCIFDEEQLRQECLSEQPVSARLGGWFELILFEWTTGWGLHPSRALIIMLATAGVFGLVVYPSAIAASPRLASPKHGIFKIWTAQEHGSPLGRVQQIDQVEIHRLSANVPSAFTWGLWFSLLSAFHIGWRDLNVGTWLSRLQPSPFALRARGWVRVVSGFQSLLSVYLIAIWALTYFGRPFQ